MKNSPQTLIAKDGCGWGDAGLAFFAALGRVVCFWLALLIAFRKNAGNQRQHLGLHTESGLFQPKAAQTYPRNDGGATPGHSTIVTKRSGLSMPGFLRIGLLVQFIPAFGQIKF